VVTIMSTHPHAISTPRDLPRRTLSEGSVGDIPLTGANLTAGLMWWLLWAAVCLLAMFSSSSHAQSMAWAAPSAAVGAGAAQQTPELGAAPVLGGIQQELVNMLKGRSDQVSLEGVLPAGVRPRVEVVLGQLDPRLKLAPCEKVNAYLPEGSRLWGRTRVGLRCEQGSVHWNVYWPVTVKVWGPAVVAVVPLKPGSLVSAADLRVAEVDLAESNSPAILKAEEVVGRSVLRVIEPGQGLRQEDVRMRRWFAAGEPVQILVRGEGFAIASDGMALSHGDEGQCARIRVDSGRVLCGRPVGERRAEVAL
jgi:flagellar basal body P-ring formation protein FlgA